MLLRYMYKGNIKATLGPNWPGHSAGAYPGFCGMKPTTCIIAAPLDGMRVHHRLHPPPSILSPVPIYTPGWKEAMLELSVLPKNTTQ